MRANVVAAPVGLPQDALSRSMRRSVPPSVHRYLIARLRSSFRLEFARPVCLGVTTYGDNDAFEQDAGDTDPRLQRFRIVPSVESPNARFLVGCAVPLDAEPYQRAAAD